MYESARLNANVLAARSEHIQSVLREQGRQREAAAATQSPSLLSNNKNKKNKKTHDFELNWEELAAVAAPRSAWAKRQAARLALRDALAAQEAMESSSSTTGLALDNNKLLQLETMKRLSMPFVSSSASSSVSPRLSLPTSSLYNTAPTGRRARVPVDVQKLKEMNRQFLHSMTQGGGKAGGAAAAAAGQVQQQQQQRKGSLSRPDSLALLLVRGRQHSLQNNPQQQQQQAQQHMPLHMVAGLRRDSLHGILREATQYSM